MNTLIIALFVIPIALFVIPLAVRVILALVTVTVFFGSVVVFTAVAEYEAARNRKARREADRRANSL